MTPLLPSRRRRVAIFGLGAMLMVLAGTLALAAGLRPAATVLANAGDLAQVQRGKVLYRAQCTSCHGRYLQGQALWQLADAPARRRAPALDQTGHGWQRSDADLFRLTKYSGHGDAGRLPFAAWEDRDVLAVIAFVKTRWPIGLQAVQATRNPWQAGMPPAAGRVDWRFPWGCW